MIYERFENPLFMGDNCEKNLSIEEDNKQIDFYLNSSVFDKTHINMSHFTLCESYGSKVLGLSGYSLLAYRLMSSFAINNYSRFNGLYCCFSYIYLARSINCGLSSAKRIIKSLCDLQIIKKIGSGRNGRNCYKVLKTYDFDIYGALLVQYETLDKKRSKRINLKNKDFDNKEGINKFGLPSWVSYYGNYERFLDNRAINCDRVYNTLKIDWINK